MTHVAWLLILSCPCPKTYRFSLTFAPDTSPREYGNVGLRPTHCPRLWMHCARRKTANVVMKVTHIASWFYSVQLSIRSKEVRRRSTSHVNVKVKRRISQGASSESLKLQSANEAQGSSSGCRGRRENEILEVVIPSTNAARVILYDVTYSWADATQCIANHFLEGSSPNAIS